MADFASFHSSVNRIPVLRASAHRLAQHTVLPGDLFLDGPAPSHDHLDPQRWSGSVDLEITVRTPLVFGEQTTTEVPVRPGRSEQRHVVDLPLDADGTVRVPPTMVKGMISRAYETFTCSRFRVFGDVENQGGFRRTADDRSVPLTYRADPAAANQLLPGRVCEIDGGRLGVEVLDGFGKNARVALIRDDLNDGHGTIVRTNHPRIQAGPGGALSDKQVFARFRQLTRHGEQVEVRLTQWKDSKNTPHLMVTGVWDEDDLEVFFQVEGSKVTHFNVWGYPCRTAPETKSAHDLFKEKTYERFFFKSAHDGHSLDGLVLPLTDEHVARYATVLRSYREQQKVHSGDKHPLNRAAETWATGSSRPLSAGDLVFVRLDMLSTSAQDGIPDTAQVIDVFPTIVGRRSYDASPRELADKQGVLPLASRKQASAADRLFGYVVPDAADGAKGGDVAARGRIIIGPVDGSRVRICTKKKVLTPLLMPKPSSARRFLTDASGGTPKNKNGGVLRRDDYFAKGQLLGTAAYPVHRRLLDGKDLDADGFPQPATRAAVLGGREQTNDAVRLTVRSWVEAGSVLRCTVSFTNLSQDELAALLWVLTPEKLVPSEEREVAGPDAVGCLRLGLGKPLGLGAVEVRIAPNGLRVRTGTDQAEGYASLSNCLGLTEPTVPTTRFPLPNEAVLLKTPWVRAMQRAAFGYTDGREVRHMSLDENKENNQTNGKTGEPHPGKGLSPRDMFGTDSGKPIIVTERQRGRAEHPQSGRRRGARR
ncbi:hypothetical protein [Propionibacterium acidifaciens]|uniref:hypothetical protein n=1 Tax=Propionibacterium acidifaciens TaxID=556499 RepID=UPI00361B77E0